MFDRFCTLIRGVKGRREIFYPADLTNHYAYAPSRTSVQMSSLPHGTRRSPPRSQLLNLNRRVSAPMGKSRGEGEVVEVCGCVSVLNIYPGFDEIGHTVDLTYRRL